MRLIWITGTGNHNQNIGMGLGQKVGWVMRSGKNLSLEMIIVEAKLVGISFIRGPFQSNGRGNLLTLGTSYRLPPSIFPERIRTEKKNLLNRSL